MLKTAISKECAQFVASVWGKNGIKQVKERPVSWVQYEANPQLKQLRHKDKALPLIAVEGTVNRIYLRLSTETKG